MSSFDKRMEAYFRKNNPNFSEKDLQTFLAQTRELVRREGRRMRLVRRQNEINRLTARIEQRRQKGSYPKTLYKKLQALRSEQAQDVAGKWRRRYPWGDEIGDDKHDGDTLPGEILP